MTLEVMLSATHTPAEARVERRMSQVLHLSGSEAWTVRLAREVANGLSTDVVDRLLDHGYSARELGWIVSPKTLQRRRQVGRLKADEGERAIRALKIHELAIEVFGDESRALEWLHQRRQRFGGQSALELARTEPGAQGVEEVLIQLDEGYFA